MELQTRCSLSPDEEIFDEAISCAIDFDEAIAALKRGNRYLQAMVWGHRLCIASLASAVAAFIVFGFTAFPTGALLVQVGLLVAGKITYDVADIRALRHHPIVVAKVAKARASLDQLAEKDPVLAASIRNRLPKSRQCPASSP